MINIVEHQPDNQNDIEIDIDHGFDFGENVTENIRKNPFIGEWETDNNLNDALSNTLQGPGTWQENIKEGKPSFIRTLLRYKSHNIDYSLTDNKKCLVFVIIHGTGFFGGSGSTNSNYYDKTKEEFRGLLRFAQNYIERYNKQQLNKNKDPKFLHLFSYEWTGKLFDIRRRPAGEILADYLNVYYPDAQIIPIAHSHGCNVMNFASKLLTPDKKSKKARIRCMIYFAPPCRQEIPQEEKSSIINPLGKTYDSINDFMAIEPENYDQLFTFYSQGDDVVPKGVVDAGTGTFALVTITGGTYATYHCIQSEDKKVKTYGTIASTSFTLYSLWAANEVLQKKKQHAYFYNNKVPDKNNFKGPQVCIETFVNRKRIGHSNDTILKYFGYAVEYIKDSYPIHGSAGAHFILNIEPDQEQPIQCALKRLTTTNGIKVGFINENNYHNAKNKYYEYKTDKKKTNAKEMQQYLMRCIKKNKIDNVSEDDITDENNIKKLTEQQIENIGAARDRWEMSIKDLEDEFAGPIRNALSQYKSISQEQLLTMNRIVKLGCLKLERFASKENGLLDDLNALGEKYL